MSEATIILFVTSGRTN